MALRKYIPHQEVMFWMPPRDVLPEDHLCFVVDEIVEQLDFSILPDKAGTVGPPAYDPRLLIKILFYGYATGTFSSRALMRATRENLAYTFLTRQQHPDFRTIADFRKNNLKALKNIFIQIVRICKKMGMIKLGRVALDGTKIRANASNQKSYTEDKLENEINEIEKAMKEGIRIDDEEDKRYGVNNTGEELPEHLSGYEQRIKKLKAVIRELRYKGKKKINITDPDANFMKDNNGRIETNYNCQASVDDKEGVIVSADVITSPADHHQLRPQIEQLEANTGKIPLKIVMDSGYYSRDNISYLEEKNIDGYIPSEDQARAKKHKFKGKKQLFSKNEFTYIKEDDVYICPRGEKLIRWRHQRKQGLTLYKGTACKNCRERDLCTRSKSGTRLIARFDNEELLQKMRLKMESEEGKREYRKRSMTIEPLFGHFKGNLKFRQFHCRGQPKVLGEFLLLCIGYNLKKMASRHRVRVRDVLKQSNSYREECINEYIHLLKRVFLLRFYYLRKFGVLIPRFNGFF